MENNMKIFYKRGMVIIGVLLGTLLILTGCVKANQSVKTYDKENEVDVKQVSSVENTSKNEITNKVEENVTQKNDEKNTTEKSQVAAQKAFSNEDLVIDGKFKLGESSKAIESYYGDKITSVNTTTEDATGRELVIIKLESLGLEVENSIEDNDPDGEMIRIRIYGNSKFKTARGIKIGDSRENVLNAYPTKSILNKENGSITVGYPGDEPVYESDKGKIYFTIENGKVTQIFYAYGIAE